MNMPFDHLSAIVAGAVVLLMLTTVDRRGQSDSVRAVEYYALSTQSASFGSDVRRDLESLSTPISLDTTGGVFSFRARLTPFDTTQQTVTYTRNLVDVRDGVPLYRITRSVDGVATGGSPGLMALWDVQAQTAGGADAADVAEVAQVRVVFEMAASHPPQADGPDGVHSIPDRKRWEATIVSSILLTEV